MPPFRFLFIGPPGVGKGTYAARVSQARKCRHISSGDLLRSAAKDGTELGRKVGSLIDRGDFAPSEVVFELVEQKVLSMTVETGFILDGFPRTAEQAQTLWDSQRIPIDHVVELTQPLNVIVTKISSRRMCADCGYVYNYAKINEGGIYMDPLVPRVEGVCDRCASTKPLVTRPDDECEKVKKRLRIYEETTKPLRDFYVDKGILHEFRVLGGAKEYFPRLLALMDNLVSQSK